ncbi:MAG: fatty acid desaturase, partial [Waterburya sp.]
MTAISPQPLKSSSSPQLDKDIKIRDILDTLPKEVFQKNPRKAWSKLIINVLCVGVGYWTVAIAPWYLLPF